MEFNYIGSVEYVYKITLKKINLLTEVTDIKNNFF